MKKLISLYALMTVLLLTVFPSMVKAQNDKEYYLRPSYFRPYDQRGINVFETGKTPDSIPFEGLRLRFGAGFTQQFQSLSHKNIPSSEANKLYALTPGFNTAMANLNLDVQLA